MMQVKESLIGKKFGMLTVLYQAEDYISPKGKHMSQWACICDCGNKNIIIVSTTNLKNKSTKSCGCLKKRLMSKKLKKYNQFNLKEYEYGIGYTLNGDEFWFDKEDYEKIKSYCWYYTPGGYVAAHDPILKRPIFLHRLVLGFPDSCYEINHKKHPPHPERKYDNRKSNLEIVTHSQNMMNMSIPKHNTSGRIGVGWNKCKNKWRAYICVNGKTMHIGYFKNFEDAVKARQEAEIKYFGEHRYDANN